MAASYKRFLQQITARLPDAASGRLAGEAKEEFAALINDQGLFLDLLGTAAPDMMMR